jgi:ATP-dependent exoDNAse (exonuclease V) alpha subunit
MLTRGLLYVADTRCRKAHIDIGDIDAFEDALGVVDNDLRRTWVKELLIGEKHES